MNYGFVINNDTCIGCHACSTACKSENDVPLGVQRTWVKSVEVGEYPDVRRSFQVTRCNHCANPPCVRICPVTAMYQRTDGIVEFDPDVCIGCKACLQACPYDAIYIDPETGSAAKCHYCAHRVEVGLEPACVVVCPEHAIIAGDLDDPISEISRMVAANKVSVRKPEQGTAPKLFYIGGEDAAMHPTATQRTPETFAWSDVIPLHGHSGGTSGEASPNAGTRMAPHGAGGRASTSGDGHTGHAAPGIAAGQGTSASGEPIRKPGTQGLPAAGPIQIGHGRMADQMVQVVWNAQHKVPWHWPVPAYLVTKGIAAGLFLLMALGILTDSVQPLAGSVVAGGFTVLAYLVATTGLLVFDLEHPSRFLRILTRPQWSSWLVKGAFILVGFSLLVSAWWAVETAAWMGWIDQGIALAVRPWALWAGTPLAIGTAVYTAFLFGQAEGRDLWQSSLLPIHLIVQAMVSGASFGLLFWGQDSSLLPVLSKTLAIALVTDLVVMFLGEVWMPHASDTAAKAAHEITHGRFKRHFWLGSVLLGHIVPLAILPFGSVILAAVAGSAALLGLYFYEYAFVTAPQEIPNS